MDIFIITHHEYHPHKCLNPHEMHLNVVDTGIYNRHHFVDTFHRSHLEEEKIPHKIEVIN